MICLPDHKGVGLRMHGMGRSPGGCFLKGSIHTIRLITPSLVKKVSRLVIRYIPSSASCTIPIIGVLFLGEITCFGTKAICFSYATASIDCGTCIFISSPSKSAL